MCWNPEVSLATFVFSSCLALYAYHIKKISFMTLLFFGSFISIQLVEFFLWIYLHEPILNYVFSCVGFFIILFLPFISLMRLKDEKLKQNMILIYFVFLSYSLYFYSYLTQMKTVVGMNKHLEWKWISYPIHLILIWFLFLIFHHIYEKQIVSFFIISIPFTLSLISYLMTNTWGTMWCWFANIYSLLILLF
jgi:hypothetical protein